MKSGISQKWVGEWRRWSERFLSRTGWVIDADCHVTDLRKLSGAIATRYESTADYYHGRPMSAEELVAEMDMAGVDLALIWQNPAATVYTKDEGANFANLLEANVAIREAADAYADRLFPAGWTDPRNLGLAGALKLVDYCVLELGFPIVKLNPAQNAYPIDSEPVMQTVARIVELGAIPAFHYGADTPFTPASGLENLAKAFPENRLIAVHMGGGGCGYVQGEQQYLDTRALGLRYPNLFFIQSAKRDTHIESDFIAYTLAGAPYCEQIAVGSDAPYGRLSWNFGGYRQMLASLSDPRHPDKRLAGNVGVFEKAARGYLGDNFARMMGEELQKAVNN